ncbi:MAG TPA: phage holin family protein [Baekduia sp.]|uniref:phage holin family protein n=1 Tax=Baekduia sp. TaxID=2600305 RepID=UPI002D79E22E|nr:phage holin family protein [Baekduia sp.]HET6510118.1 phage holin family protein [Baekduia sp.]
MTTDNHLRDRPTGELVKDLSTQVSTLVRQELELAKVELTAKGKQAGIGAGMFGGAGLFALYGVGALVATAIIALSTALAAWLAALIVGVALLAIAGVMALMGRARAKRAVPPMPEQTVATVKEDVRFTREHVAEARHHRHEEAAR